jgi:hypothetical protein
VPKVDLDSGLRTVAESLAAGSGTGK